MSDYKMIPCAHYDYLELACLRSYWLKIELQDGSQCQARAITTQTHADKTEWLVVEHQAGQQILRLDSIIAITPTDPPASFGRVMIASQ
ncbi:Rho-binding antiterminator [Shewanella xiamenensis]|uniref:Rho-binding antiterminator n=1 Tax=Shewanella xiamenensis TaxID=332186 RepID=UPI00217DB6D1|nr:Rho-binding antiterminator [Shewanella xiamenensis]MCT8870980.1 Rho-binding antiterminator [Shewanella xiamenensis]UWH44093.1 Rho-binding antiterminator [Shewanella xiamenensis]